MFKNELIRFPKGERVLRGRMTKKLYVAEADALEEIEQIVRKFQDLQKAEMPEKYSKPELPSKGLLAKAFFDAIWGEAIPEELFAFLDDFSSACAYCAAKKFCLIFEKKYKVIVNEKEDGFTFGEIYEHK